MAVLVAIEAALQARYLDGSNLAGVRAAVAVYFLIAVWFTSTLECTGYVYCCETWPAHLRSKGAAISFFGFYLCHLDSSARCTSVCDDRLEVLHSPPCRHYRSDCPVLLASRRCSHCWWLEQMLNFDYRLAVSLSSRSVPSSETLWNNPQRLG